MDDLDDLDDVDDFYMDSGKSPFPGLSRFARISTISKSHTEPDSATRRA